MTPEQLERLEAYRSWLAEAHAYIERGWVIIPVHSIVDGVCTCSRGRDCHAPGKHPAIKDWLNAVNPTDTELRRWYKAGWRNLGVLLGPRSGGLYCIDVDGERGRASWKELCKNRGFFAGRALTHATPGDGGGLHVFVRSDEPLPYISEADPRLGEGIALHGDGRFAVVPPSVGQSGSSYQLERGHEPFPAPGWLSSEAAVLDVVSEHVTTAVDPDSLGWESADKSSPSTLANLKRRAKELASSQEGGRESKLLQHAYWAGCRAAEGLLAAEDVVRELSQASQSCGLPDHEWREKLGRHARAGTSHRFRELLLELEGRAVEARDTDDHEGTMGGHIHRRITRRHDGTEVPMHDDSKALTDATEGGLFPGLYIDIGGTGTGKTQRACQTAVNALMNQGAAVCYMSLEIEPMDIVLRMGCHLTGMNWSHAWRGRDRHGRQYHTDAQVHNLGMTCRDLTERWPLHVTPRPKEGWHPDAIEANIRRIRDKYPTKDVLVVLDYLQLVEKYPDERPDTRALISDTVAMLKRVASELEVHVWCISSMSRESERRLRENLETALGPQPTDGTHVLAHPEEFLGVGKETGMIEYSADALFVSMPLPGVGDDKVVTVLAKNRTGLKTWIVRQFDGHRYCDVSPDVCMAVRAHLDHATADTGKRKRTSVKEEHSSTVEVVNPPAKGDLPGHLADALDALGAGPLSTADVAASIGVTPHAARRRLRALAGRGAVYQVPENLGRPGRPRSVWHLVEEVGS